MEWYDLLMIGVLLGTTVFGFIKGMAWQIASLAALVLSYLAALRFSEPLVATGLVGQEEPWNRFLAMLIIYLATSLLIWIAFRVVSRAINRVRLREFDRQIGGLFGLAKGVLLCVAVTFFALTLAPDSRDSILRSRSGHYIAILIARADAVMPPEVHQVLDPYLERLGQELNGHAAPATPLEAERESAASAPDGDPRPTAGGPILGDPRGTAAGEAGGAQKTADESNTRDGAAVGSRLVQPWERSSSR